MWKRIKLKTISGKQSLVLNWTFVLADEKLKKPTY
jgi:hypothetical protein